MNNIFIDIEIFLLGASIGSFLNVLIDRLPNEESINGRSHCDFCKKKIAWYDLFPIVSFFVLGGKCRFCHKKLSWQYSAIEAMTGLIFLLIFSSKFSVFNEFSVLNFHFLNLIMLWGIAACFIVIFISDLKYHLISDYLLIALAFFSIFFKLANGHLAISGIQFDILSALVVALPIFIIYFLSKERAMGQGDVYLAGIIGLLLGWQKGFLALYIAVVTGAIFGLVMILLHRKKIKSKIAFGPFLIIGTTIMLFWGEKILESIRKIYGF